jgi:hypothetical protein
MSDAEVARGRIRLRRMRPDTSCQALQAMVDGARIVRAGVAPR